MLKSRSRIGVGLVTVCSLAVLSSCGDGSKNSSKTGASTPAMPVVVEAVQRRTVPITAELVARTIASETVEVRPNVSGQLWERKFQGGTHVKKGQVLYRIDPRRYEAIVRSSKASLERADAILELAKTQENLVNAQSAVKQSEATLQKAIQDTARMRPLALERAVPERDLDAAVSAENIARAQFESAEATVRTTTISDRVHIRESEAGVEGAKAALIKAQLDLDDTVIEAPMDGIIGRSAVSPGNFVNAAETLLATISLVDPITVEFNLPETDYLRLARRAQKNTKTDNIELILGDNSIFPYRGRFTVAGRAVDEKTGTITLQAEFRNPAALIRPGQFARVRFHIEERPNALLIPERALMEAQGNQTVYIVEEGKTIALRSVVTDGVVDGFAIVTSGLKGDEQVVVEGHIKVRPGAPVTIVPARKD